MNNFGGTPVNQFGGDVLDQQLEAIGDQDAYPPNRAVEPPFRFRDTGDQSFGENLKQSGQHNMEALMGMTKDPVQAAQQIAQLFTSEGGKAIWEYIKDSYGGTEEAMNTIRKDPVGFLSDISLAGGPMRLAGKQGSRLNTAGAVVENLDAGTALMGAGKAAGVNAANKTDTFNPEEIYDNLLKMSVAPTSKLRNRKTRAQVKDTLLSNRISPTGKGVDKLQKLIGTKSDELDAIIDAADQSGRQIPAADVYKRVQGLWSDIYKQRGNPERTAELKAVYNWMQDWKQSMGDKQFFAPSELRKLRQQADGRLPWNNVPSVEPPMKRTLREQSAHGMREALAEGIPEATPVNKDISNLLDAAEPLERATHRLGNNNSMPLTNVISGVGGAGLLAGGAAGEGNALSTILGAIMTGKAVGWTPKVKAQVAQSIYHNRGISQPVKRNMIRKLMSQGAQQGQQIDEYMDYMEPPR